jgi:serine/threonine-protein kinase
LTDASGVQVKLADFGLAKAFELAGVSGVTSSSAVGGDRGFGPRCQFINFRDCGPEVDVWAAAATLYFLSTRQHPRDFEGPDPADIVVLEQAARPIRSVNTRIPDEIAEVVDHALLEDDDKPLGFPTPAALRKALEDAACRCGLEFGEP